jgi:hypothetical protein
MELPTEGLGPRSDNPAFQPQPAEQADWGEPDRQAEWAEPGRQAEWAEPGEQAEQAEQAEWAEPGEPAEHAEHAEPAEGAQAGEPDGPDGQRAATGEPRVDAALARLDELAGRPVTEHRAIFEDVHRRLRDVLGELDARDQSPSQDVRGAERRAGR